MGEPDGERGAGDDRPGDGRGQGGVANSAVGKGDDLMRESRCAICTKNESLFDVCSSDFHDFP